MKLALETLLLSTFVGVALGQGTLLWDESVNGSLSTVSSIPTPLGPLSLGTNRVLGSSQAFPIPPFGWKREFDFFTFTVPNEAKISSIYLSVDGRSWAS